MKKSRQSLFLLSLFIIFALLITLGIQVLSQNREETKKENVYDNQQKSLKTYDAGIDPFIEILENNEETSILGNKADAIKKLGNAEVVRAIPLLIKHLDYEDKEEVLKREPKTINGVTMITEYNDLTLSRRYPAVGALMQMRKTPLPALIEVIESEETNSIKSKNASYVVQQIFSDDWSKAVAYLEQAMIESKVPNGSKRLQIASQKIKEEWDELKRKFPN